ncbi:MAG: enoyl-CoA hydratase/isomerase family protein [Dehalococcoidia bacterium]|nr:enoyl-CoA hydratase/isomerase family protein [Dehalococcoidia bacterium]
MQISLKKQGNIALITIDRPDAMNSLDSEGIKELGEALKTVRNDNSLRVAIISSSGTEAFCTGADVTSNPEDSPFYMTDFWKPMIAAVNGYCFAGGLALALLCDIRLASENATFASEGPRGGILPAGGLIQRLTRAIGVTHAIELMLTSRRITASEALKLGLISEAIPQQSLKSRALEIAEQIASMAPLAIQAVKEAAQRGGTLADGLALERQLNSALLGTSDAQEALNAMREKRKPNFKGN